MEKYYLFFILALIAEIIGTITGFGSSILFVPLAACFFDFKIVLGITALFHVFSNISKLFLFKKGIDFHIVKFLGIPAVVFVIVGAGVSKYVSQDKLELTLNVFLVVVSIFLIYYSNKSLKADSKHLITGGVLSGFIAGLVGTGGAIRGITLSAFHIEKDIFIATSAIIDFGVDASRLIVYLFNGFVNKDFLLMLPFLMLISVVGSWAGKLVLKRISNTIFQKIVLLVILIIALFQVIKYVVTHWN